MLTCFHDQSYGVQNGSYKHRAISFKNIQKTKLVEKKNCTDN